ncbi:MAG: NTP transferase domain-containing protein, partial [Syntrophomonas sp.]|nr:NTP transferase domain-containing protein [Syntrophomonas sp.]
IRAERFFFLPGDYPLVSPVVYEKMLAVAAETVIPVYTGQTGHPLLLSAALIDPIMAWPDSSNLREFIRRQPASTVAVNCPGILIDIDTMEDYQRALTLIAAQGGC